MKLYKNTEWKEIKLNGEIIEIPNGWNNNNLQKLSYITDGTHSSPKTVKNTDFHYLTVRDLDWYGNIDFENAERVNKEDYDKMVKGNCSPIKNDILLSKDGTVGKTAIYDTHLKSVILSSLAIIRFNNINYKYGYFLFKHSHAKEHLFDHKNGNAIKRIVLKQLNAFEVFYPSDKEQSAIASILSTQESIISRTKDLIAQLDKRNQFMMDELLSGRLRVKEENGQTIFYKNPADNWQSVQMNGEDVDIPKDWSKKQLSGCFKEKSKSKITAKTGQKNGKYPFFNCSEKQTLRVEQYLLDEEVLYLSTGGKPSVLYSQGKSAYSTDVWAISFNNNYTNKFIYYYLKNDRNILESCFKGSGLKHLNKKDFLRMEIFYCSTKEQNLIVKTLDSLNSEKKQYEKTLAKEENIFTFLLEELMSGRLRVEI